jgi:hypothetical protein
VQLSECKQFLEDGLALQISGHNSYYLLCGFVLYITSMSPYYQLRLVAWNIEFVMTSHQLNYKTRKSLDRVHILSGCCYNYHRKSYSASVKLFLVSFHSYLLTYFIVIQLVKKYPAFFMEPEVSLPCSQKPATGPYPEPAEFSSPHRTLSP